MEFTQLISAVGVGLAAGYVMQGPQICYNRAYRTSTLQADNTMLRALALAMLVQLVGFHILVALGLVKPNVVPAYWLAAIVGGFLFGVSFVFAEGCSSTMWYRAGNGNLGSIITLSGFAIGEVLTFDGFISPLRTTLTDFEILAPGGEPATLPNLLGVSDWLFVGPIALVAGWWLWRTVQAEGRLAKLGGWPWPVSGAALGVIGTMAWLLSQGTGWDYGIGMVGATGPVLKTVWLGPSVLTWGSIVVVAMPFGSFGAALQRGELSWKTPGWSSGVRYAISGLSMGVSASLAGGCNIGHTFTGAPTLALSSLLASVAIFFGAVMGNWLRFAKLGSPLPAL